MRIGIIGFLQRMASQEISNHAKDVYQVNMYDIIKQRNTTVNFYHTCKTVSHVFYGCKKN